MPSRCSLTLTSLILLGVKREMVVKDSTLHITVTSSELRLLRVSIGAVLELTRLSTDTMVMFDKKS